MRRSIYIVDTVWKMIKDNSKKRGMKISEYIRFLATIDNEKLSDK